MKSNNLLFLEELVAYVYNPERLNRFVRSIIYL